MLKIIIIIKVGIIITVYRVRKVRAVKEKIMKIMGVGESENSKTESLGNNKRWEKYNS